MNIVPDRFNIDSYLLKSEKESSHFREKVENLQFHKLAASYLKDLQGYFHQRTWKKILYEKSVAFFFLDKTQEWYPENSLESRYVSTLGFGSSTFASMEMIRYLEAVKECEGISKKSREIISDWITGEQNYLPLAILMDGWRSKNPSMLKLLYNPTRVDHASIASDNISIPEKELALFGESISDHLSKLAPGESFKLLGGTPIHEVRYEIFKTEAGFEVIQYDPANTQPIRFTEVPEDFVSPEFWQQFAKMKLEDNTVKLFSECHPVPESIKKPAQRTDSCNLHTIEGEFKHSFFLAYGEESDEAAAQYKRITSMMAKKAIESEKGNISPLLYRMLKEREAVRNRHIVRIEAENKDEILANYHQIVHHLGGETPSKETPYLTAMSELDKSLEKILSQYSDREIEEFFEEHPDLKNLGAGLQVPLKRAHWRNWFKAVTQNPGGIAQKGIQLLLSLPALYQVIGPLFPRIWEIDISESKIEGHILDTYAKIESLDVLEETLAKLVKTGQIKKKTVPIVRLACLEAKPLIFQKDPIRWIESTKDYDPKRDIYLSFEAKYGMDPERVLNTIHTEEIPKKSLLRHIASLEGRFPGFVATLYQRGYLTENDFLKRRQLNALYLSSFAAFYRDSFANDPDSWIESDDHFDPGGKVHLKLELLCGEDADKVAERIKRQSVPKESLFESLEALEQRFPGLIHRLYDKQLLSGEDLLEFFPSEFSMGFGVKKNDTVYGNAPKSDEIISLDLNLAKAFQEILLQRDDLKRTDQIRLLTLGRWPELSETLTHEELQDHGRFILKALLITGEIEHYFSACKKLAQHKDCESIIESSLSVIYRGYAKEKKMGYQGIGPLSHLTADFLQSTYIGFLKEGLFFYREIERTINLFEIHQGYYGLDLPVIIKTIKDSRPEVYKELLEDKYFLFRFPYADDL